MTCTDCGKEINLNESWPGDNGPICQECWERVTSESWWRMWDGQQKA